MNINFQNIFYVLSVSKTELKQINFQKPTYLNFRCLSQLFGYFLRLNMQINVNLINICTTTNLFNLKNFLMDSFSQKMMSQFKISH